MLIYVADESRKMTDGVARSPSRLCRIDGKICCDGDALSTILLAFVPCFLLFVFRFPFFSTWYFFSFIPVCLSSSCPFVCAAAICYSQQGRIIVVYINSTCSFCSTMCHLYPTPSQNSFVFIRSVLFFCS